MTCLENVVRFGPHVGRRRGLRALHRNSGHRRTATRNFIVMSSLLMRATVRHRVIASLINLAGVPCAIACCSQASTAPCSAASRAMKIALVARVNVPA